MKLCLLVLIVCVAGVALVNSKTLECNGSTCNGSSVTCNGGYRCIRGRCCKRSAIVDCPGPKRVQYLIGECVPFRCPSGVPSGPRCSVRCPSEAPSGSICFDRQWCCSPSATA